MLLRCALALWDGPCPIRVRPLPASTHDRHSFSYREILWSTGRGMKPRRPHRWKAIPDCVSATRAPLLPQRRASETFHVCHGNHGGVQGPGRGSASWPLPPPSWHSPSHTGSPAFSDSRSGIYRRGGRTQDRQSLGVPCYPPTHSTSGFAAFARQPQQFNGHYKDSRPGDLAAEGPSPGCALHCWEEGLRRRRPSPKPVSPASCCP